MRAVPWGGRVNLAVFLPVFSTIAGGFAALRLQHRLHALMAFAAGIVVATAVSELLPEAYSLVGESGALSVAIATVIGFIGFSLLEAFLHQSSFEHALDHRHDRAPDHAPDGADVEDLDEAVELPRKGTGIFGLLPPLSLVVHSAMDGMAIGLAFEAGTEIGFIVLVAVLFHDFADGMNIATIALDAARGQRFAVAFVFLDAIAAPIGGLLSVLITIDPPTLGLLLATFSGVFIAVGAGHLLPESQHRDPRHGPRLVALAALGAAIVLVIRSLTPA
ncbi:MAG TPA: ZIP family metal transporter [Candidatus Limnocylindrales bacterium]|nr:ZIP family metal transporter [Candidatus Limnocylindrales bacterium]